MDDLLTEFLTETAESIEVVDNELVTLEKDPNNKEILGNIFRLVHTIKGTCGFLGLPRLESVAHSSENVLGKFRDGDIEVTPDSITVVLESLDQIKEILAELEATAIEPQGDDSALIARLDAIISGGGSPAPAAAETEQVAEPEVEPEQASDVSSAGDDELEIVELDEDRQKELDALEAAWEAAGEDIEDGDAPVEETEPVAEVAAEPVQEAAPAAAPVAAEAAETSAKSSEPSLANQSIRVSVELLEDLMTTVSELVLTRNQLMQMVRRHEGSEFTVPIQHLSQCTTELQEGVMKTRMQPIGNAWNKLPRIVRDLSKDLNKKIDLEMIGAETELDRQVLELIKDPLTHMVRNSGDHGIEGPEARKAAGKPETGKIVLNAFHEGGHIIIQITDDGAGLNLERIKAKVVENGLATEAELAEMSDPQIQRYIFHAGLSTAEKVSNVSGRGVGMDVVRTNIENISGTVDVASTPGQGSVFTIKIPLTLAIVSALIVECRGERFAIPQLNVLELVRASQESDNRIEEINDTPVLRLRDRLLPLINLADVLALEESAEDDAEVAIVDENSEANAEVPVEVPEGDNQVVEMDTGRPADAFIVVSQVGNFTFGIIVDRVFDTEEIVVKPLAPILRDLSMYSGNTILGDGSVIMIIDPHGIAVNTSESLTSTSNDEEADRVASQAGDQRSSMLVFRAGNETPKAVPLALVARLEEIDVEKIEVSGGQAMVQYRGALMPLVKINDLYDLKEEGRQPMLVFADESKSMGLAVDEIVDIIEETLNVELSNDSPGLMGTAVIAEHATEIIDVSHYLNFANSNWFGGKATARANGAPTKVLVVDDSAFFRNMMQPLLSVAGYDVTMVEDAESALGLHEAGRDFDLIISDIEMPGMDGFAFAEAVKDRDRWSDTPIVALSSRSDPEALDRGREVGFSDYVAKLDQDALLESVSHVLAIKESAA